MRRAHAPYRGVEWRKPQAAHTRPSDAHLCTRCAAGYIARVLHVLLQRHHDSRGVEATMRHDVAPQFRDHVGAHMTANTNGPAHRAQDRVITRPYRGLSTDGVRFELTVRYERTHTFQACALNHSATRPNTARRDTAPARHYTSSPHADRERFELSIPLPVCRFSRPVPSTTRPPVQVSLET